MDEHEQKAGFQLFDVTVTEYSADELPRIVPIVDNIIYLGININERNGSFETQFKIADPNSSHNQQK